MKLYLIGMPLSGKSVIGNALAKRLNLEFVDLDDYIEKKVEKTIYELIKKDEGIFRILETDALIDLVVKDNILIATGGGTVINRDNKKLMNGTIIYLDTPLSVLESRLDGSYVRPLLRKNTLQELLEQRIHQYRYFADYTIKTTTIEETVEEIIKVLKEAGLL
ncbi:MAG: shikimate kinase [Acholeplasmataceae bacterium]|jgi:shikimate kinase|nr:shikimate kinase [Acholeplasmataceae bacterium]